MSKLSKTIYVKVEKDGDESYLLADENMELLAESGCEVTVGEYQLVKTRRISLVVKEK